jgi:hypothetical protein
MIHLLNFNTFSLRLNALKCHAASSLQTVAPLSWQLTSVKSPSQQLKSQGLLCLPSARTLTRQALYIKARSSNHFCIGKGIRVAYSECGFVSLVIQRKMRMRLTILSYWLAQPYHIFPNYLINGTIFGQRVSNMQFLYCDFPYEIFLKISHSKTYLARYYHKRKNPQHVFLRRESKAVCPMSQICGM